MVPYDRKLLYMTVIVTGAAGFIGAQLCRHLLERGEEVVGIDSLSDYYDPRLKQARLEILNGKSGFRFHHLDITDQGGLSQVFEAQSAVRSVVHLAAQAGVRYSLEAPYAYIDSNVTGHLSVLEACRRLPALSHLVYASSSSVYGGNEKTPFAVADRCDHPVSLYAATKRAGELLSAAYAKLYGLPQVGLRFFTVYGPWGRPDMAYYLFTKAIFEDRPIKVFNHGKMRRDFTYIDDILSGITAAMERAPDASDNHRPHLIYNLGNHRAEDLSHFIEVLEAACGKTAEKQFLPMQPGDVRETFADIEATTRDLGFLPQTTLAEGLPRFVAWFRGYHGV